MKKTLISALLSFLTVFLLTNKWGNTWEMDFREMYFSAVGDSVPEYVVERVGENGVPNVFYARENNIEPGLQYNATIVANYALDYYKEFMEGNADACMKFQNCVESLADSLHIDENGGRYIFPWRQAWYPEVGAPFTSGMTSGHAIKVFDRAFEHSGDSIYFYYSRQLIRGFYLTMDSGGFTIKNSEGWWYEEFAAPNSKTPMILDGHIFALEGLMHHNAKFHSDSAIFLIEKGLAGLLHFLPEYDLGNGYFNYDISGKPADIKYRGIILSQLKNLYETTGNVELREYYDKWVAHDKKPYFYRILRDRKRAGAVMFGILSLGAFLVIRLTLSGLNLFSDNKKVAG